MSTFLKAYRVRLYPNKTQEEFLLKQIGCCRFVFNQLLGLSYRKWDKERISFSTFDLIKALPIMKGKWSWLSEVDSDALQKAAQDVGTAKDNWLNSTAGKRKGPKVGKPRFKKRDSYQSFRIENKRRVSVNSENRILTVGKHRNISFRGTAPTALPRSITVSYSPTLKQWHASILVQETIKAAPKTKKDVGVDPGVKTLATMVSSSGHEKHYHPQAIQEIKSLMSRISVLQMWCSKKEKGSTRQKSLRTKIAKLWFRVRSTRSNMIHKLSINLVRNFDRIHIEDTKVKNMVKKGGAYKTGINRAIHTVSIGMLKSQLTYKAKWYQKQVVFVSARNTSKTCSSCGTIYKELTLKDREWACPDCSVFHDRDINAAKNILALGYLQ